MKLFEGVEFPGPPETNIEEKFVECARGVAKAIVPHVNAVSTFAILLAGDAKGDEEGFTVQLGWSVAECADAAEGAPDDLHQLGHRIVALKSLIDTLNERYKELLEEAKTLFLLMPKEGETPQ